MSEEEPSLQFAHRVCLSRVTYPNFSACLLFLRLAIQETYVHLVNKSSTNRGTFVSLLRKTSKNDCVHGNGTEKHSLNKKI